MNTFTALGLAITAALEPARTILVLCRSDEEVDETLHMVAAASLEGDAVAPKHVSHLNGAAEIRYRDGGRILFRGINSFRGVNADTVFVDDVAAHELRCRYDMRYFGRVNENIRSAVAASSDPAVVFA